MKRKRKAERRKEEGSERKGGRLREGNA